MRARFVCLILGLLPAAGMADPFDDLRTRWQQTLTGGAALDTTIPQVRSNLNSINSTARRYWSSLQSNNGRTSLWTDIASTTISADISSNYSRLHALATAWATPGGFDQPCQTSGSCVNRSEDLATTRW